jgi:H+-transporting ATPase
VEESNADKAIKALTAALAPKARVKRNGKVESVEAKELVPGDIVIIQFGNIVPADVKLLGKSSSDEVPMQVCILHLPWAPPPVSCLCHHHLLCC